MSFFLINVVKFTQNICIYIYTNYIYKQALVDLLSFYWISVTTTLYICDLFINNPIREKTFIRYIVNYVL